MVKRLWWRDVTMVNNGTESGLKPVSFPAWNTPFIAFCPYLTLVKLNILYSFFNNANNLLWQVKVGWVCPPQTISKGTTSGANLVFPLLSCNLTHQSLCWLCTLKRPVHMINYRPDTIRGQRLAILGGYIFPLSKQALGIARFASRIALSNLFLWEKCPVSCVPIAISVDSSSAWPWIFFEYACFPHSYYVWWIM